MRPRPAEVEALDRQTISRRAEQRPPREELIQRHFAVHRVAVRQAVLPFEIERREDGDAGRLAPDVGRVSLQRGQGQLGKAVPKSVPIPHPQSVRRVLKDRSQDVATTGEEGRVRQGRNGGLEVGLF